MPAEPVTQPKGPETGEIPDPLPGLPSITVAEVEGIPRTEIVHYVRPTPRLERCGGIAGQAVEIVLESHEGDVRAVVRESTADDAVTSCVVNAIAVDLDELLAPSGTPSDRPLNMKSLLTIRFGE